MDSNKELQEAYHVTAMDFAIAGDQEMYDFYMNKMVELTAIPKDAFEKDLKLIKKVEVEKLESRFKLFINKLRNK